MKTARVFPRLTRASPRDPLAFFGPPGLFPPEIDSVDISVSFTWDLPRAEYLAKEWQRIGVPINIGGPALGLPSGEFIPGKYLRLGYTITSRGCPNRCPYCHVWRREPVFKELEIKDGWIIQDDNLLACSRPHIEAVFRMLRRQPRRAELRGLEAKRLEDWVVDELTRTKLDQIFFAFDREEEWDALYYACEKLRAAGILRGECSHTVRCYVLIGYGDDTPQAAELRLRRVLSLGIIPFAMLWMDDKGPKKKKEQGWGRLQKIWSRPGTIRVIQSRGWWIFEEKKRLLKEFK